MGKLKTLHATTFTQLSAEILKKVEEHPRFQAAQTVLLYHSLKDEVQTHDFIERWSQHKQILLPVVVGDELELRIYEGRQSLHIGAFGIEEPTGAVFTAYQDIPVAVIPGVGFDRNGNRLGRGRGYYDRLLPRLTHTYKIGICFPFQVIDKIPTEPQDIPMNEVITLP